MYEVNFIDVRRFVADDNDVGFHKVGIADVAHLHLVPPLGKVFELVRPRVIGRGGVVCTENADVCVRKRVLGDGIDDPALDVSRFLRMGLRGRE